MAQRHERAAGRSLLGHHVVGGVHGAHADLGAAQEVHGGNLDGPEHPAPVLAIGRRLLVPLDVRQAPAVAAVQRHLAPDHLPAATCSHTCAC